MRGSTVEAMSEAIDRAAVIIYGVSLGYVSSDLPRIIVVSIGTAAD